MQSLSVVIITFNEEKNIGRCIDSVKSVADEIIVLDSYSTDNTPIICREKNVTLHQRKFEGYIEQKNHALALANNSYVLSLDADEALDPTLLASIEAAKKDFSAAAYTMNRCTNYCGRFIRNGLWYPDKKLRLFNKEKARWAGTNPHDKIELDDGINLKHLDGDILHYSYNSIEEHIQQNNKFSSISAAAMYAQGRRTNWWKIIIHPWWTFIVGYFIRMGFIDGYYGFVIAVNTAHLTFLKHVKLFQLQLGENSTSIRESSKVH